MIGAFLLFPVSFVSLYFLTIKTTVFSEKIWKIKKNRLSLPSETNAL